MLRPSRPMMRPFSSSDLSSTTETVVSTAWLDATRCITAARMLRARRSASRRVSSSTWRITRALSWRSSSSSSRIRICFAWPALRPDTPLELAQLVAPSRSSAPRATWSRLRRRSSSERSRSLSSLRLQLERALLRAQALLEPRDLGAAREQLLLEPVAPDRHGRGLRRRRGAPRLSELARSGRGGCRRPRCTARGRCTSMHNGHRDPRRDQRRQHDLHLRLLTRRTAAPTQQFRAVRSSAARSSSPAARRAAPTDARAAASRTLPGRSLAGRVRCRSFR